MLLSIQKNGTIGEAQNRFSSVYPFLKIEFYKNLEPGFSRKHLTPLNTFQSAGLKHEGSLEITPVMTVGQLENVFGEKFGLSVQVSRKSGPVWLETTMTDSWTLQQQNEHGREISGGGKIKIDPRENDYELNRDAGR